MKCATGVIFLNKKQEKRAAHGDLLKGVLLDFPKGFPKDFPRGFPKGFPKDFPRGRKSV